MLRSALKRCANEGKFAGLLSTSVRQTHKHPQAEYFPVVDRLMLPNDTFKNKTAFVTGGGTGIGKAMAIGFAQLGATVVISSRRKEVLEETATIINNSTSGQAAAIPIDVRSVDSIKSAVDEMEERFGLPDVVVNNAAGNFISPTERLSSNAFKTVVDIVLNGTANVTLDVGKRLIAAKKRASFLGITATYSNYCGSGYTVPSACAKAGVEALHLSLSSEWAKYGMRFNTIQPGPFYTEGAFSRLDPTGEFANAMIDNTPVGRLGDLMEITNLALYTCSDYASYMNGAVLRLDGGEIPHMAGMFNMLDKVKQEQWDVLESMIKKTKK